MLQILNIVTHIERSQFGFKFKRHSSQFTVMNLFSRVSIRAHHAAMVHKYVENFWLFLGRITSKIVPSDNESRLENKESRKKLADG